MNIRLEVLRLPMVAGMSLLATACVNITPDLLYPIGIHTPIETSYVAASEAATAETVRTAKSGEILFRQQVKTATVLVLENSVEPAESIDLSVAKRSVEFEAGQTYYTVVNVGSTTALAACSFDRPFVHTPRLNPGATGNFKVCFIFESAKKDQIDETIKALPDLTSSRFFMANDNGALGSPSTAFQKLYRWEPGVLTYNTTEPAKFRIATEAEAANAPEGPPIGLRFTYADGKGQIEKVFLSESLAVEMDADSISVKPEDAFPKTVSLSGADIELLALKDGVLAYRILSGFDADQKFIVDFAE